MPFHSESRPLDDFEFTFESYLDDSARIEPDVNALPLTTHLGLDICP